MRAEINSYIEVFYNPPTRGHSHLSVVSPERLKSCPNGLTTSTNVAGMRRAVAPPSSTVAYGPSLVLLCRPSDYRPLLTFAQLITGNTECTATKGSEQREQR